MKEIRVLLLLVGFSSFRIIPFSSACSEYSLSATVGSNAGTDFLESLIRRSEIILEYQGYNGNDAVVAAIILTENGEPQGPNQPSTEVAAQQSYF
jgi:hypothetical protein